MFVTLFTQDNSCQTSLSVRSRVAFFFAPAGVLPRGFNAASTRRRRAAPNLTYPHAVHTQGVRENTVVYDFASKQRFHVWTDCVIDTVRSLLEHWSFFTWLTVVIVVFAAGKFVSTLLFI